MSGSPRRTSQRRPGGPGRSRVGWKAVFFGLAAIAIVAGVAWALLGSKLLIVKSVRVTGTASMVSQAQVLQAAQVPAGLPLIRVNTSAVAHRVSGITQVQSAQVSRAWPSTIVISVRLRTPVFAVSVPGGYALVDAFGVDLRHAERRPPGLPLLELAAGTGAAAGPGATPSLPSLRGSPLTRAAAAVLHELPPRIARQVRVVEAATASEVSLRLANSEVIVWGDTSRPAEKAKELTLLMRTHARRYDVSAPGTAVIQG